MENTEFIEIVKESKSMVEAAKGVGLPYMTFKRKAIELGCWNPNQGKKGVEKPWKRSTILTEDILKGEYPQYQTYKLKLRLIKEGIFKDECSECGWDKKPEGSEYSTCELDHINGINNDHRRENLRMLCPNCHSLTPTYRFRRGKNAV